MNVISLFSGCGGFDLGAMQAGLEVVGAYEYDPAICSAYERTTGLPVQQVDLARYDLTKLPAVHGLIAGPPCQDFSIAGRMNGAAGERNLFPVTIEAIRCVRPNWFVIENVPGFVASNYFAEVVDTLGRELGYRVSWRILNAADYGLAQTRRRVFIAGRRDGRVWAWPDPTHSEQPGLFTRQWVGWGQVLRAAHFESVAALPGWITRRVTVPANALISRQLHSVQEADGWRGVVRWRVDWQPAFTVTASAAARHYSATREGLPYRLRVEGFAELQGLPDSVQHSAAIGNAVPPALARAVLQGGQS